MTTEIDTTSDIQADLRTEIAEPRLTPRRAQILWGYLFLAPWIVGFLVFIAGPMLASLYLSMTNYSIGSDRPTEFIGLDNYKRMFALDIQKGDEGEEIVFKPGYQEWTSVGDYHIGAEDHRFWQSVEVTLKYAVVALPLSLALALFLAILTNIRVPGVTVFRTLFYLPTVIPAVVSASVFLQFLRQQDGWLNNYALEPFGITGPDWLQNPEFAIPTLTLIATWGIGTTMLMFLAGLQNVPTELYEAARVDGANFFSRFWHITVPMISPVILYNLVIGLIGTFQYFTIAYALTADVQMGGRDLSMYFYNMHVYREAYVFFEMGYASALAWILLIIILIVTVAVFRTSTRWVYYAAGGR
ncbi:MAG: sugar ABC transporter permease [Anaerolineae bacterium]|nr:sugar ABC transporter permease [Anaerolineae bacterium]